MLSLERAKKLLNDPNLSDAEVEKIRDELAMLAALMYDTYAEERKMHKEYIARRNKYKPENIRAIFILESPPKSGKYFYDPEGETTEPLFKAMMELIACKPTDKASGLAEFAKKGFIIVDASYTPVNHYKEGKERDQAIMVWRSTLSKDLESLTPDKKTPVVLVKANICRLFGESLKSAGFNVINNGATIPFPATGQQGKFRKQIALVLEKSGLNPAV
jgi:hypothetical protein